MSNKDEQRKQRNRDAAHRSYMRKKQEWEQLNKEYEKGQKVQMTLNRQVHRLEALLGTYEEVWEGIEHAGLCNGHGKLTSSQRSLQPSTASDLFVHDNSASSRSTAVTITDSNAVDRVSAQFRQNPSGNNSSNFTSLGHSGQTYLTNPAPHHPVPLQALQTPDTAANPVPKSPEDFALSVLARSRSASEENQPGSAFMFCSGQQHNASEQVSGVWTPNVQPSGNAADRLVPSGSDYDSSLDACGNLETSDSSFLDLFDLLKEYDDENLPFLNVPDNLETGHQHSGAFEAAEALIANASMVTDVSEPSTVQSAPSRPILGDTLLTQDATIIPESQNDLETDCSMSSLSTTFSNGQNKPVKLSVPLEGSGQGLTIATDPRGKRKPTVSPPASVSTSSQCVPQNRQYHSISICHHSGGDCKTEPATIDSKTNQSTTKTFALSELDLVYNKLETDEARENQLIENEALGELHHSDHIFNLEDILSSIEDIDSHAFDSQMNIPMACNAGESCKPGREGRDDRSAKTDKTEISNGPNYGIHTIADVNVKLKAKFL